MKGQGASFGILDGGLSHANCRCSHVKTHIHNASFCFHNTSHYAHKTFRSANWIYCDFDDCNTHTHRQTHVSSSRYDEWACMNHPRSCWNHFGTQEICEMYFLLLLLRFVFFCKIIGIPMSLYYACVVDMLLQSSDIKFINTLAHSHTERETDTRSYFVRSYANEWKMPRIILNIRHESYLESYFLFFPFFGITSNCSFLLRPDPACPPLCAAFMLLLVQVVEL